MKNFLFTLALTAGINIFFTPHTPAQAPKVSAPSQRVTKFEIRNIEREAFGGNLYVTIGKTEKKIAEKALAAWLINEGLQIVYSAADGAGGFENEGQSLRVYDVKSGATRKILSEYTFVEAVEAVKLSTGATALLVRMGDGGLGGAYFAVVDLRRGEVFHRQWAELSAVKGDRITLAFYKEDDWDALNTERGWSGETSSVIPKPTKVKPYKTEQHDLKTILKNKIINNKQYNLADENEAGDVTKMRDVKIYLWKANDDAPDKNFVLAPVMRQVNAAAPLLPTLEALFAGASEEEEKKEFSDSTFGMKLVGVVMKNGRALVKFSQPPNETNYGSLGPMIFAEAIEKTAKQFPTVKKVEICAVGETMIDSELTVQFPRCAK